MDKTLLRPMFKKRYLETKGKEIKTFAKGGITSIPKFQEGGLTNQQKAVIAATFAAPLLQSTTRPGESNLQGVLRAAGTGLEKVVPNIIALEKAKGEGKGVRTLSAAEVADMNLPKGTIAQVDSKGKINVVSKPDAASIKQKKELMAIKGRLTDIATDYVELGKPVGPLSYRQIAPLTKVLGTKTARKFARLQANIQQTTSFLGRAISGAAVSEQEAERIQRMIPQVSDTEVTFEAKMETLNKYINDTIKIQEDNNITFEDAMNIMEGSGITEQLVFNLSEDINFKKDGDVVDVTGN